MLPRAPAACKASCEATLDVCLAYLHAARLQRALTNSPCVLFTLTWESSSWRSACSLCFVRQPTMSSATCLRKRCPSVATHQEFPWRDHIDSNLVFDLCELRIMKLSLACNSPVAVWFRCKHVRRPWVNCLLIRSTIYLFLNANELATSWSDHFSIFGHEGAERETLSEHTQPFIKLLLVW